MKYPLALVAVWAALAVACAAPTPTPTPLPTPTPTPRPTATPTPAPLPPPAAFFLRVTAPSNEAVLKAAALRVTGETTPDAVVTVNAQLVEVDSSGRFQATITLTEGPNIIEVAASDFAGHRAQEVRSVIYVP